MPHKDPFLRKEYVKVWREKNRERLAKEGLIRSGAWRKLNPEKTKAIARRASWKKLYGIPRNSYVKRRII